ncbi:hypothetical protein L1887_35340 [Cichorium endivia]|nr:hypothetical protein L1887_35340 [Cichorium endivia]
MKKSKSNIKKSESHLCTSARVKVSFDKISPEVHKFNKRIRSGSGGLRKIRFRGCSNLDRYSQSISLNHRRNTSESEDPCSGKKYHRL